MNLDSIRNEFRFNARASAIIYNMDESKILLFNVERRGFYYLPGGRIEELEESKDTIKREIKEEIGWDDIEFSYLALSEEFVNDKGYNNHQINIIYKGIYKNNISDINFKGLEGDWINFKWVDINDIDKYKIYPNGIKNIVLNKAKENHLVTNLINNEGKWYNDKT